jgi:hypothetical protein
MLCAILADDFRSDAPVVGAFRLPMGRKAVSVMAGQPIT